MRLARAVFAAVILSAALAGPSLAGTVTDLQIGKLDSPDPVVAGSNLTYTITVQNIGPSTATNVAWSDPLPTGLTFVSLTAPAGWTTTTPAVGGTGTVSSSIPSLTVAASAVFTLVVQVSAATPGGTVITNVASVSGDDFDPNINNNSSANQTTVTAAAAPTPIASLADAAMPEPVGSPFSPLAILGFAVLLVGVLGATAVLAVKRVRP